MNRTTRTPRTNSRRDLAALMASRPGGRHPASLDEALPGETRNGRTTRTAPPRSSGVRLGQVFRLTIGRA
ncbi:hypothetical protein [Longispora albida]|uniref:hypothetical protein n=1 Tax=Longispora albida TaxID=203523 RepID=UPI000375A239|nr:hypothetical protein [Longispora albida]